MTGAELFIANLLLDAALSTAVDVVSKKAVNPKIRLVGNLYKVYSISSTVYDVYDSLTISAYSDIGGVVVHEIVVSSVSRPIVQRLISNRIENFEVQRVAQKYLINLSLDTDKYLRSPMGWAYLDPEIVSRDFLSNGSVLVDQIYSPVFEAFAAADIAFGLLKNAEASELRNFSNHWSRPPTLLERVNSELGNVFWLPTPEVGLGRRQLSSGATYQGIFRRNEPEGYGRIRWSSGAEYLGQIRNGSMTGYGVFYGSNGVVCAGFSSGYGMKMVGAILDRHNQELQFGEFKSGRLDGYGRKIDLKNPGVGQTSLWTNGLSTVDISTQTQILERTLNSYPMLSSEYKQRTTSAKEQLVENDKRVIKLFRSLIE